MLASTPQNLLSEGFPWKWAPSPHSSGTGGFSRRARLLSPLGCEPHCCGWVWSWCPGGLLTFCWGSQRHDTLSPAVLREEPPDRSQTPLSISPGTHPLRLSSEGTESLPGTLSAVGSATARTPSGGTGAETPAGVFPCPLGATARLRVGSVGQPGAARGDRTPAISPSPCKSV